jgi:hypothetical protein
MIRAAMHINLETIAEVFGLKFWASHSSRDRSVMGTKLQIMRLERANQLIFKCYNLDPTGPTTSISTTIPLKFHARRGSAKAKSKRTS